MNQRNDSMHFQLTPTKIIMLVLFLSLSGYYLYTMQKIKNANKDPVVDAIINHTTLQKKPADVLPEKSQFVSLEKAPISITLSEREDLKSWNLSHGYPFPEDRKLYESYNSTVLNDLANKNNDILALDVLADRAIKAGDYEHAITLCWQQAAIGSTSAFGDLSHLLAPQPDHKGDVEYGKPKLIESLAVLKTAALRGDIRIASGNMKFIKKDYEHYFGELNLSDDDLNKIDQLAQRNYDELQKMRYELGLGDFENSTPKFLNNMYGK